MKDVPNEDDETNGKRYLEKMKTETRVRWSKRKEMRKEHEIWKKKGVKMNWVKKFGFRLSN